MSTKQKGYELGDYLYLSWFGEIEKSCCILLNSKFLNVVVGKNYTALEVVIRAILASQLLRSVKFSRRSTSLTTRLKIHWRDYKKLFASWKTNLLRSEKHKTNRANVQFSSVKIKTCWFLITLLFLWILSVKKLRDVIC